MSSSVIDIRIGGEVIYSSYDATQKVGMMSYKSGWDVSGDGVMT